MKFVLSFLLAVFSLQIHAQQLKKVDFKSITADITLIPDLQIVQGEVEYRFTVKKKTDSIYINGRNMAIQVLKNSPLWPKVEIDKDKIWLIYDYKPGKTYTLYLHYRVDHPKQTLYFVGWDNPGSNQIWSQGQGKHTSYWLPSIDDDNDKITFDMTYHVPKGYTVIGNGKLVKHKTKDNQGIWRYRMKHPISSYLVAVAVGNYEKKSITSSNGTPIALYYEPQYAHYVPFTYRYAKRIFDFLEQEIGVPYPWTNYKQIPVRDFLYAGMENTTATIYAESLMTDSIGFIDRNYVNVDAHELAHQWFGDYVTQKSSASHWLQEGFATFYALLAQRHIFGDEFYYFKLYESADRLTKRSDEGKGEAVTDPKANSLTFYQKGAWALHILREKVGKKAFGKGVKTYLETYKFQNVSTVDFIREIEKSSGTDLTAFVDKWLRQKTFPAKDAIKSLKKSDFIRRYMKIAALRQEPLDTKYDALSKALDFPVDKFIGQEVVHQLSTADPSPKRLALYKKAFATNNILVRQAIAISLGKIPKALKSDYESLLKDPSYLTQEKALFNLWKNFPDSRGEYLDELQNTQGFYDKNVRMMWLTLALVTSDYHPDEKTEYYEELSGYTAPEYDYSIRQNAFGHLYQINTFSDQAYKNLLQACTMPVWRFRNFARELLANLLKEERHQIKLMVLEPILPKKEQAILAKTLKQEKQGKGK